MIKEILTEGNESDMLKNVNAILKAGDSVEKNIKNISKIDKTAGAKLTKYFNSVMDECHALMDEIEFGKYDN